MTKERGEDGDMFDKKTLLFALGGLVMTAVAVIAVGLTVRKQTNKLRQHIRTVSRGVYNFGSALQLLSGAGGEDDCESCSVC